MDASEKVAKQLEWSEGEVRRQVRAVPYLADNPHASSRLWEKKNRAEIFRQTEASRAEDRKHTSETLIGSFTISVRETKTKMISETFTRTSTHISICTHVQNI